MHEFVLKYAKWFILAEKEKIQQIEQELLEASIERTDELCGTTIAKLKTLRQKCDNEDK